jgi:hypothetical protein
VTAAQLRVQKGESHRIQVDKQRGN